MGLLSSLVTGLFSAKAASDKRGFDRKQSATVYQRGTADLRAAGLNPILAAKSDMSAPAASASQMYTPDFASARKMDTLLGAEVEKIKAEKAHIDSVTNNNYVENELLSDKVPESRANAKLWTTMGPTGGASAKATSNVLRSVGGLIPNIGLMLGGSGRRGKYGKFNKKTGEMYGYKGNSPRTKRRMK